MSVSFDPTGSDQLSPDIERPKLAEVRSGILEVRTVDLQSFEVVNGCPWEPRSEGWEHFGELLGRFPFEGFLQPHCLPPFTWVT